MEYLILIIPLLYMLVGYGLPIFLGVSYLKEKKQQKAKVAPTQGQQAKAPIFIPLIDPPHIPHAGLNRKSNISGISPISSSGVVVATNRQPPALKDQSSSADQTAKAPRRRRARPSSEATSQSLADLSPAPEGGRKQKTNYAKVRSEKLRKAAIEIHGRNCCACRKNFDEMYGPELAKGYIEIHHLKKIAAGERTTDPATDLAPLCSNCHTMADRLAPPPRTIAELRFQLFPESRLQEKVVDPSPMTKSPVKIRIGKIREKKPQKDS